MQEIINLCAADLRELGFDAIEAEGITHWALYKTEIDKLVNDHALYVASLTNSECRIIGGAISRMREKRKKGS
jgi:hypothetical protein